MKLNSGPSILLFAILGLLTGFSNQPILISGIDTIVDLFIRLFKLLSTPIIFIAILSTISGMGSAKNAKYNLIVLLKYTLLTTLVAAAIGLCLLLIIDPNQYIAQQTIPNFAAEKQGYFSYLATIIPDNCIRPFLEANPISLLLLAVFIGAGILMLPEKQKNQSHQTLKILFNLIMNLANVLLKWIPLAVFAFFAQFAHQLPEPEQLYGLSLYLLCIVAANLIQAILILPGLLALKGISVCKVLKAVKPALILAFISKSSSLALPATIQHMEKNLHIKTQFSRFILPLCISVNMNACAAFILITTLFVAMANGVTFSGFELIGFIFLSTLAAMGNAGIPMGCFMLTTALLSNMNIPVTLMGIILPFYAIIDMLESSINVWSDVCVTTIIAKENNGIISDESHQNIN
ncbi:MAG: dicarboxylate/amino acid:cation symporter [Endozoicomonadaceae bacterium]|nr:dicarboxylate/amino acid:cation symporter [Endozoicomonadaceae bacterium]